MTSHLCLSVTFLGRIFHGKDDGGEVEWPPSPMRLYQALLAGARTGCNAGSWSDKKADAFHWLECHQPPLIVAPYARQTRGYTFFVPDNVGDREFDRSNRLVTKVACANYLIDGDTVYYVWPLDKKGEAQQVEILCRESRHLLALGWGIDQVVGNGQILDDAGVTALPGSRWHPWKNAFWHGVHTLRTPKPGSLEDLENVHRSFLQRLDGNTFHPPLKFSQFDKVAYIRAESLPPRSFAVFELPDGVSFRQENAVKVAAMMRSIACNHAKSDTHSFPGGSETYVAGHAGTQYATPPRFSYLPLPSIGSQHADGMIRRLLIAEPFGEDGTQARWVQERLLGATLFDNDGNERGRLLDLWRQTSTSMLKRYAGESQTWCTVTPVILPGYDKKSHVKAEKLFLVAVRQAGISVKNLSDISMRKAPFFPGSHYPSEYFLPDYIRTKQWPGWHVRLKFREPLRGPLAIGAGRHIGLGIFAISEV